MRTVYSTMGVGVSFSLQSVFYVGVLVCRTLFVKGLQPLSLMANGGLLRAWVTVSQEL